MVIAVGRMILLLEKVLPIRMTPYRNGSINGTY
jgi:hypothetical protein